MKYLYFKTCNCQTLDELNMMELLDFLGSLFQASLYILSFSMSLYTGLKYIYSYDSLSYTI
jgi:hypothetical protein